jgi:hypothetical protein
MKIMRTRNILRLSAFITLTVAIIALIFDVNQMVAGILAGVSFLLFLAAFLLGIRYFGSSNDDEE